MNRKERRRLAKDKPRQEAHNILHKVIGEFIEEVEEKIDEIPLGEEYTEDCVQEDYLQIFDWYNTTLTNFHSEIFKYVRNDYFKEMFKDSFFEVKKEKPDMDNMEIIDMLFDTYRKSRKFKQQPYIRPKGPGVKR